VMIDPGLSGWVLAVVLGAAGGWGAVRLAVHSRTTASILRGLARRTQRLDYYPNGYLRAVHLSAVKEEPHDEG